MAPSASATAPRGLWLLEWRRMVRTPRALALVAVYVAFGLIEPLVTRYQNQLLRHVSHGVRIQLPPPTAPQALDAYTSQVATIGLVVVVAIAASSLTFDARHGLAVFLRSRATVAQLIGPRIAVSAATAALAYLLGTLAAWYETSLLIGSLPAGRVLAGIVCGGVYLAFAVALTALAASVARATIGATGIALAVLLLIPVAGTAQVISRWLPSTLVNAPAGLTGGAHQLPYYGPALIVTIVAGGAILLGAIRRLRNREI
jgi:ABC-2 type transport system permease protein